MRRSLVLAAVVFPLVVLAFGIVRSERELAHGRRWTFEVTGYDPRDLLRGHYIQYRLALDEVDLPVVGQADGQACEDDATCCYCLAADSPDSPAQVERSRCEAAVRDCDGVLQASRVAELQRYYISEARAAELTKRFQDASREHRAQLVVAIDPAGIPHIDVLLVDGMPIEQAPKTTSAP